MPTWDYEVFLSHNSRDKPAVEALARRLLEVGVKPWLDKWDLVPGEDWLPAIEGAMRACPAIAVCVGPAGFGKVHHTELQTALNATYADEDKRVLPVLLPGSADGGADVPEFLQLKTWIDYRREDEEAFDRMVKAIRGERPGARAPDTEECPYRGLEPFRPEHARFFYGREREVSGLLEALQDGDRLLLLVGASGSGKSSMVLAGVLPAVQSGQLDGSYSWRVVSLRPGADPCRALARALLEVGREGGSGDGLPDLADALARSEEDDEERGLLKRQAGGDLLEAARELEEHSVALEDPDRERTLLHRLDRALQQVMDEIDGEAGESDLARELSQIERLRALFRQRARAFADGVIATVPEDTSLLLVVDQFEELFTLTRDSRDRDAFMDALLHAVRAPDSRVHAIVTARADFLAKFLADPLVAPVVQSSMRVAVSVMDREQIERAIRGPAGQVGLRVEDAVVDALVEGVSGEPGDLPLLQFTLYELWLLRKGGKITWEAYTELGGLKGAIAKRAESVFAEVGDGETGEHDQAVLRRIFGRLVQLGEGTEDTRRRAAVADLHALDPERAEALVDTLVEARLLTAGAESVEVAHEAVIREWARLRNWIDEDRDTLRLRQELGQAEELWSAGGRGSGDLWRGGRLERALELREAGELHLSKFELEFLETSREERDTAERLKEEQRTRAIKTALIMRYLGGAAIVMAVVAGLLGTGALRQRSEAIAAKKKAETAAILARARGILRAGDAATAAQVLMELQRGERMEHLESIEDSGDTVLELLTYRQPIAELPEENMTSARFSPRDADRLVSTGRRGIHVYSVSGQAETISLDGWPRKVTEAWWSRDGTSVLAAGLLRPLVFWRLRAPHQPIELVGGELGESWRSGNVPRASLSARGDRALLLTEEGTLLLWRLGSVASLLEHRLGLPEGVVAAWFDHEGDHLLASSTDGGLYNWDLTSPAPSPVRELDVGEVMAVSADTDHILARTATDLVVHLPGGDRMPLQLPPGLKPKEFEHARLSPGGGFVVSLVPVANRRHAYLWNLESGGPPIRLRHQSTVLRTTFDPKGRKLATIMEGGDARVYYLADPYRYVILRAHRAEIAGASFSADGNRLLTLPEDDNARVWKLDVPGSAIWLGEFADEVPVLETPAQGWIGPAGSHVLVVKGTEDDRRLRLVDLDDPDESAPVQVVGVRSAAFALGGEDFVTVHENGALKISDSEDGRLRLVEPRDGDVDSLWWLLARGNQKLVGIDQQMVGIRLGEDGGAHALVHGATGHERVLAGSREGGDRVLVARPGNSSARLYELAGGPAVAELPTASPVVRAALSPSGELAVTVDDKGLARLWSPGASSQYADLSARGGEALRIRAPQFCAGDERLLAATIQDSHSARIFLLGEVDGAPQLLDEVVFTELTEDIVRVRFNPGGDRVMTLNGTLGSFNARVYALEVHDGELIASQGVKLRSQARFCAVKFKDDRTIVTVDVHGRIRRWPLALPEMLRAVDSLVHLSLEPANRMVLLDEDADTAWSNYEAREREHGRVPRERPEQQ